MTTGRKLLALLLAGLVLALAASCTSGAQPRVDQREARAALPETSHSTTVRPATPEVTGEEVAEAAQAVSPGITLGAVVYDRRADRNLLTVNNEREFPAASVVKLLIAIDTLRRSPSADATVARMLTYSDNQIASALWVAGDGPAILRRTTELIGLRDTAPPPTPGRWGSTLLSARDVVATYRYIRTELPEGDRELIVDALAATSEYATDGRYQYFGIPAAIDKPWAIKQGWGKTPQVLMVHSTGLVGHGWRYIVVLLAEHPRPGSWPPLKRAVTAAAQATAPLVT